jgi:hypothetical protein
MYGKCRQGAAMKLQPSLCDARNADTRSGNTLNFEKLLSSNRYIDNLGVKPDAEKRKTIN